MPPRGDAPQSSGAGGQRPADHMHAQGRQQVPALTEEMLIRQSGRAGGRSRNPFRRKKAAEPAAPNPWLTAAGPGSGPAQNGGPAPGEGYGGAAQVPHARPPMMDHRLAEAPSAQGTEQPTANAGGTQQGKKGKKGKQGQQAGAPTGNGWFHNPFAKQKTTSSVDRGNVSSAQMWAGPRRAILFRRMLGALAVLLLLFLFVKMNGKASKADVQAEVDARVKSSASNFPRGAAVLWAAPLVKVFATYDPDHTDDRSRALEPYAINGIDSQMGWNGAGDQSVIDMVMSDDVQVTSRNHGIVRSTVQVQDGSWRCVAVPVFAVQRGGSTAFGLTSAPVYVPCAGLTTPPKDTTQGASNDTDLAHTFQSELLPPFMAAWAQSDTVNLKRYLLPGTTSFGLGGAYTGDGEGGRPTITEVYVPAAAKGQSGTRRTVTFTTTLLSTDGKASQTSRYQVAVVQKNGQWYFASDPTPAVGIVGGDQLPDVQPSQGTGGMYSQSPAPYPSATTSTDVQQPGSTASATP